MTTQTKADVGHSIVAAMQAGDMEGVLAQVHPDVEIHEPESLPYGGEWKGREGFAELLGKIMAIAELAITDYTLHETADGIIMAMDLTFTSQGTGKVFETRVVELDRIEDGMLRDIDVFYKDVKATVEFFEQN